jgi:transcriptional regulator with XRE-family HTH domain
VKHEEVKKRLLANPRVREAYENPPLPLAMARAVVERRKELGMTQEELAELMGTSQAQVWRIERGDFNPTAKTLSRLEEALGVSVSQLYHQYQPGQRLTPKEQLQQWRNSGLLLMSDEDFALALEMEEVDPGQLGRLIRIIEGIELEEGKCVRVTIKKADEREAAESYEPPRELEVLARL